MSRQVNAAQAEAARAFAGTVFSLANAGNQVTPLAWGKIAGRAMERLRAVAGGAPRWLDRESAAAQVLLDRFAAGADRLRIEHGLMLVVHRINFAIAEDGVARAA